MEQEEILRRIERTEKVLKNGIGNNIVAYIAVLDMLRKDYEDIKRIEQAKSTSYKIIEIIDNEKDIEDKSKMAEYMRNAYDTLARHGDFEAFMIAMEWNRPIENQFYLPRRRVLKKHGFIQGIQDLLDRKIKMLVIEAPPRNRKISNGRIRILLSVCNEPTKKITNGWKCEHACNRVLSRHTRLFKE